MYGQQTTEHQGVGGGNLEGTELRDRVLKETESVRGIFIVTLNIRLGRAGGLEKALRALRKGNIGIGVLQ